jgi:hypothetical protein
MSRLQNSLSSSGVVMSNCGFWSLIAAHGLRLGIEMWLEARKARRREAREKSVEWSMRAGSLRDQYREYNEKADGNGR